MLDFLFSILKLILVVSSPFVLFILFVVFTILGNLFYFVFIKKKKLPKKENLYSPPSFFDRVFIQFPRRFVIDRFERDPNEFREFGLHLYCGEQGSGKTTTVVHDLLKFKKMYPKCKIRTNMSYIHEDGEIYSGEDMISNNNGIYGQIEVIDEIQSWYSSLQSKNFPPQLIEEICQQRKQRKMIIGTAQVFSRVAKPLREVCAYVHVPKTYFGCLTVVRTTKPYYWNEEKQEFTKFLKSYFYVHTDEIRNSFDTYHKIEKMKKVGFRDITPNDLIKNDMNIDLSIKK